MKSYMTWTSEHPALRCFIGGDTRHLIALLKIHRLIIATIDENRGRDSHHGQS